MLDVQGGADSGLCLAQSIGNGFAGSTFHQGYHAGRGVDQQIAGADFLGGIFPLYEGHGLALHSNSDFHMYHDLST